MAKKRLTAEVRRDSLFYSASLRALCALCGFSNPPGQEHNILDIYPENFALFAVYNSSHHKDSLNCLAFGNNAMKIRSLM